MDYYLDKETYTSREWLPKFTQDPKVVQKLL